MKSMQYDFKKHIYSNESHIVERDEDRKGTWVLKEKATGKEIDTDRYRHDLAERNNLKLGPSVESIK